MKNFYDVLYNVRKSFFFFFKFILILLLVPSIILGIVPLTLLLFLDDVSYDI